MFPHGLLHINPWSINPFSGDIWLLVQDVIEDSQTQVGLPEVINVRKSKRDMQVDALPVFYGLVVLPADITAWFFNMVEDLINLIHFSILVQIDFARRLGSVLSDYGVDQTAYSFNVDGHRVAIF